MSEADEWADLAVAQRVVHAAAAGCGERGGQRARGSGEIVHSDVAVRAAVLITIASQRT